MGMWQVRLAFGLLVGAGWVISWPAIDLAAEKPPANAEGTTKTEGAGEAPKADEAATAKIEKQINGIEDRMKSLQQEEFQVSIIALKAQAVAEGADIEKYRQELEKGSKKKEHLEFRAAMESAAGQWRTIAEKYERIVNMTKTLERDREKATPALQAKIDELSKRATDKYRSLVDKVVSSYEKCADYKNAIQAYLGIIQLTPENKRDRGMKEKLGDLYERSGDFKDAMTLYKGILDSIPEKDRFKDRQLVEKVAGLYEKIGDFKNAMTLYKGILESIPEKDRFKDRGPVDKIVGLCEKIGDFRTAAALYKGVWTAIPEKDRGADKGFGEKFGDLCDKAGDPKTALNVYRLTYGKIPADKQAKDGAGLKKKIRILEANLGIRTPGPLGP